MFQPPTAQTELSEVKSGRLIPQFFFVLQKPILRDRGMLDASISHATQALAYAQTHDIISFTITLCRSRVVVIVHGRAFAAVAC